MDIGGTRPWRVEGTIPRKESVESSRDAYMDVSGRTTQGAVVEQRPRTMQEAIVESYFNGLSVTARLDK